jgi:hypothetical protein
LRRVVRGLALVFAFAPVHARADAIQNGVQYLLSQQGPDGSFGGATGESLGVSTAEALAALRVVGQGQGMAASSAELFLGVLAPPADNEVQLRRVQLLRSTVFAPVATPLTTIAPGFAAMDPLDLAWTLRALRVPGPPDPSLVADAETLAQAFPLPTGCYGYADNSASYELTANVVLALTPFAFDGYANFSLQNAIACLSAAQSPDGSYGESPADTAAVLVALLQAPGTNGAAIALGRTFLLAAQQPDGSWNESVRGTALAVQALGQTAPDLLVTTDESGTPALVVQNPQPLVGQGLDVSLNVQDRSGNPAPSFDVRFIAQPANGGAPTVLGDVTGPALAAGAQTLVTAHLPSTSLGGKYTLRAIVNPDHVFPETDFTNNEADAPIDVVQGNELAISSSDIQFLPAGGTSVTVQVSVHNLGVTLPISVQVAIYQGNPSVGTLIGSATLPAGLPPNGVGPVSVAWNPQTASGPTAVFAIVDPGQALPEANRTDNEAFRFYYPGSTNATDLAISSNQIGVTWNSQSGQQHVTLTVPVHDLSAFDASNVQVAVFSVLDGSLLAQTVLPTVPANGTAVAQLNLLISGSQIVSVVVDPNDLINDPDRSNNTAQVSLQNLAPAIDVYLSQLASTPEFGPPGTLLDIKVLAGNNGTQAVSTSIQLMNVTDNVQLVLQPVNVGAGQSSTVDLGTIAAPDHPVSLEACIDPSHSLNDANLNNNCSEYTISEQQTDLSLHPRDIQLTPVGANVGEKVHATATVRNQTSTAATANVLWYEGITTDAASIFLGATPVQVAGNGSATAQFDFIRQDGPVELHARVANVVPKDNATLNNATGRNFYLDQIVDPGTAIPISAVSVLGEIVRSGRLTPASAPDLVVGYNLGNGEPGYVAVYQPGLAGGYNLAWSQSLGQLISDIELVDLDNDGIPETVVQWASVNGQQVLLQTTAFEPDGTIKWNQSASASADGLGGDWQLGLGDINGDGIVDVVQVDTDVRVYSGDDGHVILDVPLAPLAAPSNFSFLAGWSRAVVLDVFGDGNEEILAFAGGLTVLLDSTGKALWQLGPNPPFLMGMSIADLDLDGYPEIITSFQNEAPLDVIDARTGKILQQGSSFSGTSFGITDVAAFRQDGLSYPVAGNNGVFDNLTAFSPDLTLLWQQALAPDGAYFIPTSADLLGLGRPQVIGFDYFRAFSLQDGRDGSILVPLPPSSGSLDVPYVTYEPAIVADLAGNGTSQIALPFISQLHDTWNSDETPSYGPAVAVTFSSTHWVQMPTAWPTRELIPKQIDDNLHFTGNYRWWTQYNVWDQQFLNQPATLLPDLAVSASDLSASPSPATAGNVTVLSAVIHNIGGEPASNVKVSFYDGDPTQGGADIGDTVLPGPLAVRTGTATATVNWTAYPEGQHQIFVVANSDRSIQESGYENNTASTTLFVQTGTQLCDLALDPTSLGATPPAPSPGEAVALSVNAFNQGAIPCAASLLTVYNANPGAGGTLVGTASIPTLAVGQTAPLSVTTVVMPGTTFYWFIADQAGVTLDANRSNNTVTFELFVPDATVPDLQVTNLTATPNPAYPGEPVQITATVADLGSPSPPTNFVVDLAGVSVASGAVPALLSAASTPLAASISAPSATSAVSLTVDPAGSIADFDRANNTEAITLQVQPAPVTLTATASPSTVGPDTNVTLTLAVTNVSSQATQVTLSATVLDSTGAAVTSLISGLTTVLGPGETQNPTAGWYSGSVAPGVYQLQATAMQGSRTLARAAAFVTVTAEVSATTAVITDRGSYVPGQTVRLTQRVINQSRNTPLSGASLTLTLADSTGMTLYRSVRQLQPLASAGFFDAVDLFAVSPSLPPGAFGVTSILASSSGAVLSQSVTAFQVTYQAAQEITATITVPNPFGVGQILPADVTLTNPSALALTNGSLVVDLIDAATLSLQASASQTVNLSSGQTQSQTLSIPTTGITTGEKIVVAQLNGRSIAQAITVAESVVHVTPPVVTVTGVTDQEYTNQTVTPVITVTSDTTLASVVITLNGQPFTSGTAVSAEGNYVLFVDATDIYNNSTQVTVRFTIDKTPPVVTLGGFTNGEYTNQNVTPTFTATDLNLSTVVATLNGQPFTSGTTVTAEGTYTLSVTATDKAGNQTTASGTFTIDKTPPVVTLGGFTNGEYTNQNVTPTFTATDLHLATVVATLNGQPFASGTTVTAQGTYTLLVVATDLASNQTTASGTFTIDTTPPVVTLGGFTNGEITNQNVTPTFTATDLYLSTVTATLNGSAFTSGTTVSAQGTYTLSVTAKDLAGNQTTASGTFTIDKTPPVVTLGGFTNGEITNQNVTPTFTATDMYLSTVTATLNGAAFTSGTTVTAQGTYTLTVTATDKAGNQTTVSGTFTIYKTPPVITVTGVSQGQVGTSFTIAYSATDPYLVSVTATLDGAPFASGTTVTASGTHTLRVTAVDKAGNTATVTISFEVITAVPSFNFAACALGNLVVENNATVNASPSGPASLAANGTLTLSNNASVSGDAVCGGNAIAENNAVLSGTLYYGGTLTKKNNAKLGHAVSESPAPQPCTCDFDIDAALSFVASNNNNNLLESESYFQGGAIVLSNNAKASLPVGRFYLTSVTVQNNAALTVQSGAAVSLYVQGNVVVQNNSMLGVPPNQAGSLLVVSGAQATNGGVVTIENNANATLLLAAPMCNVALSNNAVLYGSVIGLNVTLQNNQPLVLEPGPQAVPPPLTCP